jgi:hypothetical protein
MKSRTQIYNFLCMNLKPLVWHASLFKFKVVNASYLVVLCRGRPHTTWSFNDSRYHAFEGVRHQPCFIGDTHSTFDKVIETTHCFRRYFHCFGRIWNLIVYFAILTVLKESGSSLFISLFSLFWKNLEAHCFHYFRTDSPTKTIKRAK